MSPVLSSLQVSSCFPQQTQQLVHDPGELGHPIHTWHQQHQQHQRTEQIQNHAVLCSHNHFTVHNAILNKDVR